MSRIIGVETTTITKPVREGVRGGLVLLTTKRVRELHATKGFRRVVGPRPTRTPLKSSRNLKRHFTTSTEFVRT